MKGQVSIETLIIVGVLLLLFVTVSVTTVLRNIQTDIIADNYAEQNLCKKLSLLISESYAHGPTSEIFVEAYTEVTIEDNEVKVGNNYCEIIGRIQDASLTEGKIRIKNITGVVQLENV